MKITSINAPRWFPYVGALLPWLPMLALSIAKLTGLSEVSSEFVAGIASFLSAFGALAFGFLKWGPRPKLWLVFGVVFILLGGFFISSPL